MTPITIRLAVFDWAGTAVDFGCFAPVAAFVESFAAHGVSVSTAHARAPMGLHKRDHIVAMLHIPEVAAAWRAKHGREWTQADVDSLFSRFIPLQLEVIGRHCELIPGILEAVAELRRHGVLIGSTTGYFREAAQIVRDSAARAGYIPDCSLIPEDVAAGRPYPWMIFRIMEQLRIYPPAAVVKIGDTVPDIEEARNAGVWAVGVTLTGSEVGLTLDERNRLSDSERTERHERAATKLRAAGAHEIVESAAELPRVVESLNARMRAGEKP